MRVLYLNPSAHLGGAEISLLDMMASIRAAAPDWQLHLIVGGDGALVDRAKALGVETSVLQLPDAMARIGDAALGGPAGHQVRKRELAAHALLATRSALSYVRKLRRAVRDISPDVLHAHGFKMLLLGTWARPARVPIIWHIHDFVTARPLMRRVLCLHRGACSAAVANSHSTARDLQVACGRDLRIFSLYNGVDLSRFSPEGPALDLDRLSNLPPAPPGTIRVGLIATLARWKGHPTFLRAIAMLPENLPIRAYMIGAALYKTRGSQEDVNELRALAAQLGLADRVGFTGFVMDPAPVMRALDIVVHASTKPEPFGMTIVEAMASGRAVIASQAGGAAEIMSLGKAALGHPPGNTTALSERIYELATNAPLRQELGRNARRIAEIHFDRVRLAGELIPIYREIASVAGAAEPAAAGAVAWDA